MTWADLAAEIDRLAPDAFSSTRQMVDNWRRRGIPQERYLLVAKSLRWSVEQLLGDETPVDVRWPFPNVSAYRFHRLGPADKLSVEAAMLRRIEELERKGPEANQSLKKSGRRRRGAPRQSKNQN